jgi:endo-1,4-beta-mannosidase
VVAAAEKNQVKLILVLGDQSGNCDDGHWKDRAWYEAGYKQVNDDLGNGLTPLPYIEYVKLIVNRYKDSKTIAMWEPINEPESSDCKGAKGSACYTKQSCKDEVSAAKALRSFFDDVGGTIKRIDPNHIVSSGVIGDGQCGAVFEDYKTLHESDGIDVASFHDYNRDEQTMPGDEWNGLQKRLNQMKIVNKPLFVGEVGMLAMDDSTKCVSYAERRDKIKAKMDAQFKAGIVGFLPWALTGGTSTICNYDIVKNDPLLKLLDEYPVKMGSSVPRPAITVTTP